MQQALPKLYHILMAMGVGAMVMGFASVRADPAAPMQASYENVEAIHIHDFIGTLLIERGGEAFSVRIDPSDEGGPLTLRQNDQIIELQGEEGSVAKLYRLGSPLYQNGPWLEKLNGESRSMEDRFDIFLESYPKVTITIPDEIDLLLDQSALKLRADIEFKDVQFTDVFEIYGQLGPTKMADLHLRGMGVLSMADVEEYMRVHIQGSAEITAQNAGRAFLKVTGSGDIRMKTIQEQATIALLGSGDIAVQEALGGYDVHLRGSGDVVTDRINGPTRLEILGSGSITVDEGRAFKSSARPSSTVILPEPRISNRVGPLIRSVATSPDPLR
ncbi:MAG: hypothetical protein AAF723_04720, partial [Pseudomonadota bacterium]